MGMGVEGDGSKFWVIGVGSGEVEGDGVGEGMETELGFRVRRVKTARPRRKVVS